MQEPEPEFRNFDEIEKLFSSDLESKRQVGIGKVLQNGTLGIVNLRHVVEGLRQTLGKVNNELESLNKNLTEADEASKKLTQALNKITRAGVIVAIIGLFVAIGALALDYYKTFFLR